MLGALTKIAKQGANIIINDPINKILKDHNASSIECALSYRMKRDIIDGLEAIINKSK